MAFVYLLAAQVVGGIETDVTGSKFGSKFLFKHLEPEDSPERRAILAAVDERDYPFFNHDQRAAHPVGQVGLHRQGLLGFDGDHADLVDLGLAEIGRPVWPMAVRVIMPAMMSPMAPTASVCMGNDLETNPIDCRPMHKNVMGIHR